MLGRRTAVRAAVSHTKRNGQAHATRYTPRLEPPTTTATKAVSQAKLASVLRDARSLVIGECSGIIACGCTSRVCGMLRVGLHGELDGQTQVFVLVQVLLPIQRLKIGQGIQLGFECV